MGNEETQGTLGNDMHPYSVCVALLEQKRHHSLDATSFHKKKRRIPWILSAGLSLVSNSVHSEVVTHSLCLMVKTGEHAATLPDEQFATGSRNSSRAPTLTGELGEVQALKPCPFGLVQPALHRNEGRRLARSGGASSQWIGARRDPFGV